MVDVAFQPMYKSPAQCPPKSVQFLICRQSLLKTDPLAQEVHPSGMFGCELDHMRRIHAGRYAVEKVCEVRDFEALCPVS